MPKISVVLPTVNGEKHIKKSIESVINQTFSDWELIIVNNCSKDNTLKICESYAKEDQRIKIITNKIELELAESLNAGFKEASGEYLTWTSDDNKYRPRALEFMANYLDKHPKTDLISCDEDIVDENGKFIKDFSGGTRRNIEGLTQKCNVGACFMYRKTIAEKVGEYDKEMLLSEGYEYWCRIAIEGKISYINTNLYEYMENPRSLTARKRQKIEEKSLEIRLKYSLSILQKIGYEEKVIINKILDFYFDEIKSPAWLRVAKKVNKKLTEKEIKKRKLIKALEKAFSIKYEDKHQRQLITILGNKITRSYYKIQNVKEISGKPTIAFQLDKMDIGGLEEVVLRLASSAKIRSKFNTVIIAEETNKGRLADVSRKLGIPVYSFFKNTNNIRSLVKDLNIKIVNFNYNVTGAKEYKELGVGTLYTIHENYIWLNKDDAIYRKNRFYKHIDKFIAVSNEVQNYFSKKFEISKDEIEVVPNGISYYDINKIKPLERRSLGFQDDDFVLVCSQNFAPHKYHFAQIEAIARLKASYPSLKLLLVGEIENERYFNQMKKFMQEKNVEMKIKVVDFVPRREFARYIKTADCFISTSITEGFSIPVLEAMLYRKPLILTDIGGARDVIENEDIGIIVPDVYGNLENADEERILADIKHKDYHFDNVGEITAAIEKMFQNRKQWEERGRRGNDKVREAYSSKRVNKDYLRIFSEMLMR